MGRMLSALLVCALLACGPVRAEDSNNGDAATKTSPAASTDKSTNAPAPKSEANKTETAKPADYREEIEELRQLMREQAQQLSEQQKQLELLREQLSAAARKSEVSAAAPAPATSTVHVVTGDMATAVRPEPTAAAEPQEKSKGEEAPTSIHIKGITLTPGGYFAAESVYRTRAASADINTPFTGIPFNGNSLSKQGEFNASGRQSRISMLAEGKLDHAKFTGYYETDFLSAGVTSNNRQSNSYTMRQRQFWGQASLDSGWSFTGGQMWSLVTETKKGVQNRTEAPPLTIDPQYNVGFGWARQYGFRVAKSSFDDKLTLAFAVEGPQTTISTRGVAAGKFYINAPGAGGGLLNAFDSTGYTINSSPDFVLKAALDPGWGHYELFGVVSRFRDRVFPCGAGISATNPCPVDGSTANSIAGAFNDSRAGGGIGANLRAPVLGKYGDIGLHVMGGDGVGRYGSAQLADVTARPDGTLAPIRGGNALATVELHPTPKLDVYLNYGVEYAFRAWYNTTPLGALTATGAGFGSPFNNNSGCNTETLPNTTTPTATPVGPGGGGTCQADLRSVQEGTIGFWHRFYKGNRGTLQWGVQYSYLTKSAWSGNAGVTTNVGVQPKAIDNMVFTSFRYVLP